MPTIQQLNQRHPSHQPEETRRLRALYEGGRALRAELPSLLKQRPAESPERYQLRIAEAHYRNYIGPIVDYFASMLFTSKPEPAARRKSEKDVEPEPGEFYSKFRADCDRGRTDIDAFFKARITNAMIERCDWIRLRQQTDGGPEPRTLAEFERRGLNEVWLEAPGNDEVYDWETDDEGNLEWAIVHSRSQKRNGPGGDRKTVVETWEYLTTEEVVTYRTTYDVDKPPQSEFEVPEVDRQPHNFGQVPLVCIELPTALWVSNRLESPQLAHFRLCNAQTWGMSTSCFAMPVFELEQDADGNFNAPVMGAGVGLFIKKEEKVSWLAPPATPFEALSSEIKDQKDEIFRIAHQMALGVENNAAAVGRSAESKAVDAQSTRVVLIAYAQQVKEALARTYDTISAARGEKFTWTIGGLDEFAAVDVMGFLEALTLVQDVGGIPSRTANIHIKTKLAESLLAEADQATKATIRAEIEKNTPEPIDPQQLELEKAHALAANLTGPNADGGTNGGAGAPGGRKPPAVARGGSQRPIPAASGKKSSN
jgi:hypothetical protein